MLSIRTRTRGFAYHSAPVCRSRFDRSDGSTGSKNISAQMRVTCTGYEYLKALRGSIAERMQWREMQPVLADANSTLGKN